MKDKRFTLASRIIHWGIAFCFLYLLLTILLRMYWMNKGGMAHIIQEQLSQKGITIDEDTARGISGTIRRPMWSTHTIAGYVMVGLYIIRMLITFIQGVAFPSPFKKGIGSKAKARSWIYIVFYVLLFLSLATGLLIEFGPGSIHEAMEELHKKSLTYMVAFIILHIGGVLIADARDERGLISKIINGEAK